nr:hypothetical protein [Actinomyces ruminis]
MRTSTRDLRARPVFHHTHDAIQAHLTVVTASLAAARHLQAATVTSTSKNVHCRDNAHPIVPATAVAYVA